MKFNKWTVGLAAVGVVSLASAARADEENEAGANRALKHHPQWLRGYGGNWRPGTDQNPNSGGPATFPPTALRKMTAST